MNYLNLKPDMLDEQSPVSIDEWVDLNSNRHLSVDDNPKLTKQWLAMLTESGAFQRDLLGRVWGFSPDKNYYYPYHVEHLGKKYGIRVSREGAN